MKFNRELHEKPLNNNLNVKDQNLHHSFLSTSDLKESQIAQKQFSKKEIELSVESHSEIWMENKVMKNLFSGMTSSIRKFFKQFEQQFYRI